MSTFLSQGRCYLPRRRGPKPKAMKAKEDLVKTAYFMIATELRTS
jgi:hypothetical protein